MDINKLRKEHQKNAARIAELELQVAQADSVRRSSVDEAVAAAHEDVGALELEVTKLKEALRVSEVSGASRIDVLQAQVDDYVAQCDRQRLELSRADDRIADLVRQVNDGKPDRDLLSRQVDDLKALLARVEGRMKRKELEEQAAILNRKAATFAPVMPRMTIARKRP